MVIGLCTLTVHVILSYRTNSGNGTLTVINATDETGIGFQALNALTTGGGNTAVGSQALSLATTAGNCTAVGLNRFRLLLQVLIIRQSVVEHYHLLLLDFVIQHWVIVLEKQLFQAIATFSLVIVLDCNYREPIPVTHYSEQRQWGLLQEPVITISLSVLTQVLLINY